MLVSLGYQWGKHNGYKQGKEKYAKELEEAREERAYAIGEMRKREHYLPLTQGRN